MNVTIELDRDVDGRWFADVPELPGAMVYGQTRDEAIKAAKVLVLQVLADRLAHQELPADFAGVLFAPPVDVPSE